MELTLMTWNLKGSELPDPAAVVDHARAAGADVIALQEVQHHQARAIGRDLGASSVRWSFKHWPLRRCAEGLAVVGVTRTVHVRVHALSFPLRLWSWRRRIAQCATLTLGDTPLLVVNTHLSPHDEATRREREADKLLATVVPAAGPIALAGDLNARPGAPLFMHFAAAGLRDAWTDRHPDGAEVAGATNWHGWQRGTTAAPGQRLDYVLVSRGIEVVRVTVPHPDDAGFARFAEIADHLPVTATLSV